MAVRLHPQLRPPAFSCRIPCQKVLMDQKVTT
jgi:hypothetical protein